MNKNIYFIIIFSLIFVSIINSMFIIKEGNKGISLIFGKIKNDSNNSLIIYNPGLNFKIPFIEKIKILDSKINIIESKINKFMTSENKIIIIDYYIKWKINDYKSYYLSTNGNIHNAETIIKIKFNDKLKSEIIKLNSKDIITDYKNKIIKDLINLLNNNNTNNINFKNNLDNNLLSLGIKIIDARIKKIDFPSKICNSIYEKMISERKSISSFYRDRGKQKFEKLKLITNNEVEKIISKAKKEALLIKYKTDSEILKKYTNLFKENLEFYIFIKNLKMYEKIFNKNDTIILDNKNNIFKYLN